MDERRSPGSSDLGLRGGDVGTQHPGSSRARRRVAAPSRRHRPAGTVAHRHRRADHAVVVGPGRRAHVLHCGGGAGQAHTRRRALVLPRLRPAGRGGRPAGGDRLEPVPTSRSPPAHHEPGRGAGGRHPRPAPGMDGASAPVRRRHRPVGRLVDRGRGVPLGRLPRRPHGRSGGARRRQHAPVAPRGHGSRGVRRAPPHRHRRGGPPRRRRHHRRGRERRLARPGGVRGARLIPSQGGGAPRRTGAGRRCRRPRRGRRADAPESPVPDHHPAGLREAHRPRRADRGAVRSRVAHAPGPGRRRGPGTLVADRQRPQRGPRRSARRGAWRPGAARHRRGRHRQRRGGGGAGRGGGPSPQPGGAGGHRRRLPPRRVAPAAGRTGRRHRPSPARRQQRDGGTGRYGDPDRLAAVHRRRRRHPARHRRRRPRHHPRRHGRRRSGDRCRHGRARPGVARCGGPAGRGPGPVARQPASRQGGPRPLPLGAQRPRRRHRHRGHPDRGRPPLGGPGGGVDGHGRALLRAAGVRVEPRRGQGVLRRRGLAVLRSPSSS